MRFFYESLNKIINRHSFIKSSILFLSKFCPWISGIFYALFVLKIYIESRDQTFLLICQPILALLITVLFRVIVNRPRPINKYNINPIQDKPHYYHSFPSIHTSLAISVALTVYGRGPNMFLLLSALAIIITLSRLLTGEHYLTDILFSIMISFGIYYFVVLL